MTHQDGADRRVFELARFMQARDAREYGSVIEGVIHPTWDEASDLGRDEYVKDAKAFLDAVDVIDRLLH